MKFFDSINEGRMIGVVLDEDHEGNELEVELPIKFEVCLHCHGKGKHVSRAIDGHGLTREDFAEDPDFEESYFRGDYDVPCDECHGNRVVPELDYDRMKEDQKLYAKEYQKKCYFDARERESERRWGY